MKNETLLVFYLTLRRITTKVQKIVFF